ncbi:MAG TPA: helix-turn-helix transcriptional regulator [Cyclobacteriaceae bacterium]|nr:helix-turn-helix transcriptional regulator [Cyclobacteriaceae bacterium]
MKDWSLGENIRLLRVHAEMSQKTLAGKLDVDESQLSRWERDEFTPGIEMLVQIADECGVHPIYFFENVDPSDFENFTEDIKYATMLRRLPPLVQDYVREAIEQMSKYAIVNRENAKLSFMSRDPKKFPLTPHAEIRKFFKKKRKKKGTPNKGLNTLERR